MARPSTNRAQRGRAHFTMRLTYLIAVIAIAALTTSCGESQTRPPRVSLTIVNAAPGFAALTTRRGPSNRAELGTLQFPGANVNTIDSGTYNMAVETPDTVTNTVVPRAEFTDNLEPDQSYLYVMAEENASVVPLIFSRPIYTPSTTTWDVRLVNATQTVPTADVYLTPPNTDLTTVAPLGTVPFKQSVFLQGLEPGDAVVTVTEPGSPQNVLFTSNTVTFQAGFSLELIIVPDVNGFDGVLSLIFNAATSVTFLDVNSPPSLRPLNGAQDRLPRDFYLARDFTTPVAANVAVATNQPPITVPNETNLISVTPAGNPSVVEVDIPQALERGALHNLVVSGPAGTLSAVIPADDLRRNNEHARIRFLNAVNYYETLYVFLLAPGTDITTVLPSWILESPESTARELAAATTFELTVVDAATRNVVYGPVDLSLSARGIYTVGLFDSGDGTTVTALQLDDIP